MNKENNNINKTIKNTLLWWENQEPDFINEKGIKWWIDYNTIKYCKLLNKYIIYVVKDNDYITRVIVDNEKKEIIFESQQLDAIACFCDVLKLYEK
ncbi:MAG: hypothetical protein PHF86_08565 [Candidatus Nanoarchaeia archaeon]|jgi:hypothetical protein|nr:hypothetical protein [Candidatus Nanoarchaeia archaeon]